MSSMTWFSLTICIFLNHHATLRTDSAPRPMLMSFGLSQMVLSVTSSLVRCRAVISWRTSLFMKRLSRLCQQTNTKMSGAAH